MQFNDACTRFYVHSGKEGETESKSEKHSQNTHKLNIHLPKKLSTFRTQSAANIQQLEKKAIMFVEDTWKCIYTFLSQSSRILIVKTGSNYICNNYVDEYCTERFGQHDYYENNQTLNCLWIFSDFWWISIVIIW